MWGLETGKWLAGRSQERYYRFGRRLDLYRKWHLLYIVGGQKIIVENTNGTGLVSSVWEGGVLGLRIAVVVRPQTLASLLCRDGACRVFTSQADIVCTKRKAP